ncbi:MAG: lecithin retinol acyltransferase family protein [Deltaproteobacteria bacterium]|jgi:hypothetical protein|nr:lecithin retinol acyltransferase family protein [Deltaproteobacteria bacterium]
MPPSKHNFQPGDHLKSRRIAYTHHGIYVGNDEVVHYLLGGVSLTTLEVFTEEKPTVRVRHADPAYEPARVVGRALSRLAENEYNLVFKNCEHFCNWCVEGQAVSRQVDAVRRAVFEAFEGAIVNPGGGLTMGERVVSGLKNVNFAELLAELRLGPDEAAADTGRPAPPQGGAKRGSAGRDKVGTGGAWPKKLESKKAGADKAEPKKDGPKKTGLKKTAAKIIGTGRDGGEKMGGPRPDDKEKGAGGPSEWRGPSGPLRSIAEEIILEILRKSV